MIKYRIATLTQRRRDTEINLKDSASPYLCVKLIPFLVAMMLAGCAAETATPPPPPVATAAPALEATGPDTSSAPSVPMLIWHREGGIAGFCDVLIASTTGAVQAGTCNAEPINATLTEAELAQLKQWATAYAQVVIVQGDPAVADAMFTTLEMNGLGGQYPGEAEEQAMLAWAQAVYQRVQQP